jgi:hypothetical protein
VRSSAVSFSYPIPAGSLASRPPDAMNSMARWNVLTRLSWLVLAGLPVVVSGCTKPSEITRYQVPKEQTAEQPVVATEPASDENAGSDRMLAALVPHGGQAWSFKLAGPAEAVGKCADSFDGLVKSVTFAGADAKPQWKLPEGWTQNSGTGMRLATIVIPSEPKPLELSVIPTSWSVDEEKQSELANVNRWRGQMQLEPIAAADLDSQTRSLELAKGKAIVVDLTGKLKTDGMQPPFAGMAGKGELPAGHPTVSAPAKHDSIAASESNPIDRPSGEPASKKKETEKAPAQEFKNLPFTFSAPTGWKTAALPTFAEAAYSAGDGSDRVDISVTPMMGQGGDLLSNVNRWRQQLGLQGIASGELNANAPAYKIGGKSGNLVRLYGRESANPRPAMSVALVEADGTTWIFKMKGGASAVDAQQENFQKLIDSIKFK